jgi:hypothetical protein
MEIEEYTFEKSVVTEKKSEENLKISRIKWKWKYT